MTATTPASLEKSTQAVPANRSSPQSPPAAPNRSQSLQTITHTPQNPPANPHRPQSRTPCHPTPRPTTQAAQRAQLAAHLRQQEASRTITCRTRHSPSACLTTPTCAAWGRSKVRGQGVAKESSDAGRGKGGSGDRGRGGVRFYLHRCGDWYLWLDLFPFCIMISGPWGGERWEMTVRRSSTARE